MSEDPRYGDAILGQYDPQRAHERTYIGPPLPPPGAFARGVATVAPLGAGQPRDREPLYGVAVEEQDHALESLWRAVQELEQRLGPALMPTGPQGGVNGQQQPAVALPPIVERVQTFTKKTRLIEAKVREIADRVEV